tara:strand:+ start:69 stop:644 length:576 start_codon:yes stop_codon:yes gene_type:complete
MFKKLFLFALIFLISGCSSNMKTEDFIGQQPRLVLEDYFVGQTKAWGMFHDRFGNLKRQFLVDISGSWDGEMLILDENFVYADGEIDRRIWKITKINNNTYKGTADDVIGVAKGSTFGNALNWTYEMDLKVGGSSYRVKFNDWMYLQPNGVLLNRAEISKWGIQLGVVTLSFQKNNNEVSNSIFLQKQAAE